MIPAVIGKSLLVQNTHQNYSRRTQFSGNMLKVLSSYSNFGGVTRNIRSGIINWRPSKFFLFFYDKVSREEHKSFTAA
jgi:hypothetical protein